MEGESYADFLSKVIRFLEITPLKRPVLENYGLLVRESKDKNTFVRDFRDIHAKLDSLAVSPKKTPNSVESTFVTKPRESDLGSGLPSAASNESEAPLFYVYFKQRAEEPGSELDLAQLEELEISDDKAMF